MPVVAAAVAAAITAATVGRPAAPAPPAAVAATTERWEGDHRGNLLSLKSVADAALLRGDLRAAYDGYGRVLAIAAEHDVTDPVVAGVRATQDQVFAALTARRPAVASVEPPTPLTPPTTATGSADRFLDRFPDLGAGRAEPPSSGPAPTTRPSDAAAPPDPTDAALAAVDAAPPLGVVPPPPRLRTYARPGAVGDDQIGAAITAAIGYLRAHPPAASVPVGAAVAAAAKPAATPPPPPGGADDPAGGLAAGSDLGPPVAAGDSDGNGGAADNRDGEYVLVVYALLHAAQAADVRGIGGHDPGVVQVLEQIKRFHLTGTYSISLRASALAVYARPEDRAALEADVRWLTLNHRDGAYTYGAAPARMPRDRWDNSNSQYGLLGVWSGAQAGVPVADDYWQAVQNHWVNAADVHGTWDYGGGTADGPTLSMTLAGIASLLVTRDYLDRIDGIDGTAAAGLYRLPALDAGLDWLDDGDHCLAGIRNGHVGYTLYGLERVGLASGYKYFGDHDWYGELAAHLVAHQQPDGSFGNRVDTAYGLLFLSRGRHPILFNKLRYAGDWNDRPGDVAHLARFAGGQLERPLNWQVVNVRRDGSDWLDAPVLYVSGRSPPTLAVRDYAALRDFALGGGLIFTHADGDSPAATAWAKDLARRCFPGRELAPVAKSDPLNAVVYHLKDPPPLLAVDNGSRVLMVHSPTDVAAAWQLDATADRRPAFELGVNVFAYAAGKRDLNNRLASPYVPPPPGQPRSTRTVARLRYAGDWDPEPYAWTRFARLYQWRTGGGLSSRPVDLDALEPGSYPAAFLTGTARQAFAPAEAAAARAYVAAGGVLVVDDCGGRAAFDRSVRQSLIPAAFPEATLAPLPPGHPALVPSRPGADDLRQLMPTRPYVMEATGTNKVPVEGFRFGRGWVIYSPLDLTTGLLGTNTFGVLGYEPAYAAAFVKNVVLWADARAAVLPTN